MKDRNAHLDALSAKDASVKLWLEFTNLNPEQSVKIEAALVGVMAKAAAGEVLTAPRVDSVNTFDAPNAVEPTPVSARIRAGKMTLKLEPGSVTVVALEL